ncbi:MAG: putative toxin-antitoxin system toxin component, PIN family [Candidatus Saccharimonadales bacterium]
MVIDTNVWYSAFIYGGKPEKVVNYCLDYGKIYLSPEILEELVKNLKNKAKTPYKWIRFVRLHLEKRCTVLDINVKPGVVRSYKDEHVVALAVSSASAYVITGDEDLLELGVYNGVNFIDSFEFLQLVTNQKVNQGD